MIGEYSSLLELFLARLLSYVLKRRSGESSAFFYLLVRRNCMSYKYSKGSQVIGDLKAADDAERNTQIDFGEDLIDFETGGARRLRIENAGVVVTGSLSVTGDLMIPDDSIESGMLHDNIISGQTEQPAGNINQADEMLISDGGLLRKIGVDNLFKYGLGALDTTHPINVTEDYIVFTNEHPSQEAKQTSVASFASALVGTGNGLKTTNGVLGLSILDMPGAGIQNYRDKIFFADVSNAMQIRSGSIADIVTNMAGTGLSANSGVLSISPISDSSIASNAAILLNKINTNVDMGGNFTIGNQSNHTATFSGGVSVGSDFNVSIAGSNKLAVQSNEIVTSVPIHISGSLTEGLRIAKGGNDYREIQFETNGVDTAFIQVDNTEGLQIGCQSFNDKINFWTTGGDGTSRRMTIGSGGYIGINVASPQKHLHISGSHPRVKIDAAANSFPGIELAEGGTRKWALLNDPGDDKFLIKTDANTRLVVEQNGNVGIGTDSPDTTLHVDGDTILDGQVVIKTANSVVDSATLTNNSISFYLDESNNQLKVRVKYSDGLLKTGTIALS